MEKLKVLIHVNEPERWDMALMNISKLLQDVGKDGADAIVLVNGPAVCTFTEKDKLSIMKEYSRQGISFYVCRNSIKQLCKGGDICMIDDPVSKVCINKKGYIYRDVCLPEKSLSAFIKVIPTGITEIIKKQHEGFAYVKP